MSNAAYTNLAQALSFGPLGQKMGIIVGEALHAPQISHYHSCTMFITSAL